MRLSGKTLVSFSISTLNVFGKTLTLILNSQKLSNSHSRLSTFNSQYFEKIDIHSKKPRWSCTKYAFFCKAFKIIPSKICLKAAFLQAILSTSQHKRLLLSSNVLPQCWNCSYRNISISLSNLDSQQGTLILENLRVSFSISTLNFFIKTLILILDSQSQALKNMRVKKYKSSTNLVHFSRKFHSISMLQS